MRLEKKIIERLYLDDKEYKILCEAQDIINDIRCAADFDGNLYEYVRNVDDNLEILLDYYDRQEEREV